MTKKRKSNTSSLRPVFHPSINGFSISNAITMPSEDGYAVYAEVLFDRVTIGEFIDKGDGGMYSFRANPQFSVSKIESVVRSFPGTNRDYGLGPMEVECDLCQVVDSLLEMEGIAEKLEKNPGRDYVAIDSWKGGKHFSVTARKDLSDEELDEEVRGQLEMMGITEYEIRRYRGMEDLEIKNTDVTMEMLKA